MDVGTGNYAGAAMNAVELAGIAAKELGIPADAVDLVGLGTAIAKGDVKGMQKYGAEVASDLIEHVPGMPSEMKDALQAGAQFAGGNTEKAKAEAAQLHRQRGRRPAAARRDQDAGQDGRGLRQR